MSKNNKDRNGIPRIQAPKVEKPAPVLADNRGSLEQLATTGRSAQGPSVRAAALPAPTPDQVLKVRSQSNPASVAGAIAGFVKEKNKAELQCIGAGAINQAVKAIAIARGYVAPAGYDLICIPAFLDIEINGEDRTAIRFVVLPNKNHG